MNLEVQISWQAQHFVNLHVQILRQVLVMILDNHLATSYDDDDDVDDGDDDGDGDKSSRRLS